MTHPREQRHRESRLPRIPFPRMDVERARLPAARRGPKRGVHESRRQDPKVGPARRRQRPPRHAQRRRRELRDAPRGSVDPVRIPSATDVPVPTTGHRKERRVVAMPLLDQDIEGPLGPADDREARRPESRHLGTAQVLDDALGAANRLPERFGRLVRDPHMVVGMRGEFMAGRGDALDHRRMAFGYPPHGEEGAARIVLRHQFEQPVDRRLDPALEARPALHRRPGRERDHLEILLHIHREEVSDVALRRSVGHHPTAA